MNKHNNLQLPAIEFRNVFFTFGDTELATLDRHDHSKDPYFTDPWDKRRHPAETIL